MDSGVPCSSHNSDYVLAKPVCTFWAQLESCVTLAGPLTHPLDLEGEEQVWGTRLLGDEGGGGQTDGGKLARLRLNPRGRAGPLRPGEDRTAGSCQAHNLILRQYSLCPGGFQLAVLSFTDGFAAANYKFVSNSFSDALGKRMPMPLQIINS